MAEQTGRLLTDEEIFSKTYKASTAPEGFAFTLDDGTLRPGPFINLSSIKELLEAQRDLTISAYKKEEE